MGAAYQAAEAITSALEAQDWGRVRQWVADDFVFVNPNSPIPQMNVDEWLGMNQILANAFSDFTFNFEILEEQGNQAWVAAELEGTHDGDFDLSPMNMGVIPATGKHVSGGRGVTLGTVNANGKIEKIEVVEEEEGGGLPGILAQLGVDMG